MHVLELDAFRATPLVRAPFPYLIVPAFIRPGAMSAKLRLPPAKNSRKRFASAVSKALAARRWAATSRMLPGVK